VLLFPSLLTYFPVRGVPTVVGMHDAMATKLGELTMPSFRDRLQWRLKERIALRRATRLFTVSEASRAAVAESFGLEPGRIAVVPEAPDPAFFPRSPEAVGPVLESFGLGDGEPYAVYAAGLSPHKSVETLIEGLARVGTLRLVLAGTLEGGPYPSSAASIRSRIEQLGLEERVLLPGFVADEELACLYSGAAAAVVTSLAEGFGLPAVEAAACGTPTVLSDLPAHRETLGDAARFFVPGDAEALAAELETLLADPELRRSLGERGRERVAPLTWDASADRLHELVREVAVHA
jgi:glycosyltransferase involved in cell wall biosynthesis